MAFQIEDRLLKYLQGKISFNEWLDGAATSSNNSGVSLGNSASVPIPSFSIEDSKTQSRSTLNPISLALSEEDTNLLGSSADGDKNLPNSSGAISLVNYEDNPTLNDSDASDVDEDFDEDYEEEIYEDLEMDEDAEHGMFVLFPLFA